MAKQSGSKKDMMVVARAVLRDVRISPQKARLVVNMIKGRPIEQAVSILRFSNKKAAKMAHRLLLSAISNAREQSGANIDNLWIAGGFVDMGPEMRRFMPRAQGRATPIRKRSSHITLMLGQRI